MKVIAGEKGSGKTREMIELAVSKGAIVVCENVDRVMRKIEGYGLVGKVKGVVDFEDFLAGDIKGPFVVIGGEKCLGVLGDVIAVSVTVE